MTTKHEQVSSSPGGETIIAVDTSAGDEQGAAVLATRDPAGTHIVAVFTDPAILDALTEIEGVPAEIAPRTDEDKDGWADALASRFLRAHRAISARIDALDKAEARETDFLRTRFATLRGKEEKSLSGIETSLLVLAQSVTYPKGAKSRKVGYGAYGLRKVPGKAAKLDITDEAKITAWLEEHAPDLVTKSKVEEIVITIDKAKVLELATSSEVLPDGCAVIPPVPETQKLSVKYAGDDAEDGA